MSYVKRIIALGFPAALGICAAAAAILDQGGHTNGYDSLGFLFAIACIALALVGAGIVIFIEGKQRQLAILMLIAAFSLPGSFLSVLYIAGKYYGE